MIAPRLMRSFADLHERATFVEIGANDGVMFDPLRPYIERHDWRGVLVEPVPHMFERLRANYAGDPRLALENAAIAAADGLRTIYFVDPEATTAGLPAWADQIASFDLALLRRQLDEIADADAVIRATEVNCLSFESLCERHGIERPDLILVDTEGADAEIVGAIDLARRGPRLLVFEHRHLPERERRETEELLVDHGYTLVEEGLDTWALDMQPDDELSRRWRKTLETA